MSRAAPQVSLGGHSFRLSAVCKVAHKLDLPLCPRLGNIKLSRFYVNIFVNDEKYFRLGTAATARRSWTTRCGTWRAWWRTWTPLPRRTSASPPPTPSARHVPRVTWPNKVRWRMRVLQFFSSSVEPRGECCGSRWRGRGGLRRNFILNGTFPLFI